MYNLAPNLEKVEIRRNDQLGTKMIIIISTLTAYPPHTNKTHFKHTYIYYTWSMDNLLFNGPALPRSDLVLTQQWVQIVILSKMPQGG